MEEKQIETLRLYDSNPYGQEFTARVLSCEKKENKGSITYEISLDQTMFFPEEGGQSADTGSLGGVRVLDVKIRKGILVHLTDGPLEPGTEVCGAIDWSRRYSNMQNHTGEHIFSGLVHQKYGYDNVGFHLSDQVCTLDFNGVLDEDQVNEIELAANEAIYANIPIQIRYPLREELETLEYRSKIEIAGQVRLVEIPGVDLCACCAPHVNRTGEVGSLKVMSLQNYKGGVRISILCGRRALLAAREKADILRRLTQLLSSPQEKLEEAVERLKNANGKLTQELSQAKGKEMEVRLAAIPAEQDSVLLFDSGLEINIMRQAVNRLMAERKGICGVFSGDEEAGYTFLIGSSGTDCREIAKLLREQLGAKGGGSPQMIQGSLKAARAAIEKIASAFS